MDEGGAIAPEGGKEIPQLSLKNPFSFAKKGSQVDLRLHKEPILFGAAAQGLHLALAVAPEGDHVPLLHGGGVWSRR